MSNTSFKCFGPKSSKDHGARVDLLIDEKLLLPLLSMFFGRSLDLMTGDRVRLVSKLLLVQEQIVGLYDGVTVSSL